MATPLVICRCEEVTDAEIAAAVAQGARTPREARLATRAGMGACGGKTCRALVEALLAHAGCADGAVPRPRFPVRPITLGDLARRAGADGGCA